MELGYSVTIPTNILLDTNLSPLERILFGVIVLHTNRDGQCTADPETLAKNLRFKADDKLKQVSDESLIKMVTHLEDVGHLRTMEIDGVITIIPVFQKSDIQVSVKAKKISAKVENSEMLAKEVLAHLSQACIIRGYKKTVFKEVKSNLEPITARLNDGHSKDDCIRVVNIKFLDDFFKENPKYLTPQTLFRPNNFERYLVEAQSSRNDVLGMTITKTGGIASPKSTSTKNVDGVSF